MDPDDDELLAALGEALDARRSIPDDFIDSGKRAFDWRDIDAELAVLTYDSHADTEMAAITRAESASPRVLTFSTRDLTIELEITDDALVGQVVPAQPAQVEVQGISEPTIAVDVDEIGCFVIRPVPAASFCILFHAAGGFDIRTDWLAV